METKNNQKNIIYKNPKEARPSHVARRIIIDPESDNEFEEAEKRRSNPFYVNLATHS